MARKEAVRCKCCGVRLTVKHIVTECINQYKMDRQKIEMNEILDTSIGTQNRGQPENDRIF